MLRTAALALVIIAGCPPSPSEEAAPVESQPATPAPAPPAAAPTPAATTPEAAAPAPTPENTGICSLQIHTGGAWVERGLMSCLEDGGLRLLVAGDAGLPTEILAGTVQGAAAYCQAHGCDMGLLPGDVLYDDGLKAEEYWPLIWDRGLATLDIPFALVLGNHEYRHEFNPELKRKVLEEADGRAGLISPGPSYALRILGPDGAVRLAIAAVDTDSVSNPIDTMPGLGEEALATACGTGAPTVWLGHHPPSSQGGHHTHEAHVETALRARLKKLVADGCRIAVATAGHDHDLQAFGPGCEEEGVPGVVVAGPSAKGFRPPGPQHLSPCTADGAAVSRYFAGPKPNGGFAWLSVDGAANSVQVQLVETLGGGASNVLSTDTWAF